MPRRKEPRIPDALLDQLLAGADAKTAFDPDGLLDDLKKALAERTRPVRAALRAVAVRLSTGAKDSVCTGASDGRWRE